MVRIRQMTNADFSFVQNLAGEEKTFTVPSEYILWMLHKLYPEVCLVVVNSDENQIGYLIGLINDTEHTLFIWQLAVTPRGGEEDAATSLLEQVKQVMVNKNLTRLSFTMQSRVARLWGYQAGLRVFGALPEQCGDGINGEPEYTLCLKQT